MPEDRLFASTRVRDVATGESKAASAWQRVLVEREGITPFDAWARIAAAIVARTMRIDAPDEGIGSGSG